jgi:hypothetical protein
MGQFALIVSNGTTRAIKGIAVRWGVMNPQNQVDWTATKVDRLSDGSGRAIVRPAGAIIATPSGFVPTDAGTQSVVVTTSFTPKPLIGLRAQARLMVLVDTVILEDGRVLGPDASGLVDEIQSRHRAAQELLAEIAAFKNDPKAINRRLSTISSEGINASTDLKTRSKVRLARRLLRSEDVLAELIPLAEEPLLRR